MKASRVKRILRRRLARMLLRMLLAVVLMGIFASVFWKEWESSEPADVLPTLGDPRVIDGEVVGFERRGNMVAFSVVFQTGEVAPYLVEAVMNGRVVGSQRVGIDGLVRIPAAGVPVNAMLAQFDQHYAEAVATWVEVENMPGELELDVDWEASKWAQWRWGNFAVDTVEARNFVSSFVTFRLRRLVESS